MMILIFITLFPILVVGWICLQLYRIKPKNKIPFPPESLRPGSVPKMRNPPAPPESESKRIIEMYEYIKTRAYTLENVKDVNPNEAIPLWINIDEIYNVLLMHKDGSLEKFLQDIWNSEYHSFGCDADDFELPEMRSDQQLRLKTIDDTDKILKSLKKND